MRRFGGAWSSRIAALAAVGALLLASCQLAPADQSKTAELAREFVVAGQPSDYVFLELTNDAPLLDGQTWKVKVDALIRIPQIPPQKASLHFIIGVDRGTGTTTIIAQG